MTLLAFLHKIGLQAGPGRCVQNLSKGVLPINELAQSVGPNLPAFLGTSGAEKAPGNGSAIQSVRLVEERPSTSSDR